MCMYACVRMCMWAQVPEEVSSSYTPGAGVLGSCKPLPMGSEPKAPGPLLE